MIHNDLDGGGYYGVNHNSEGTGVLLQLGHEMEQIRLVFTPKETRELLERLQRSLAVVDGKKENKQVEGAAGGV